VGRDLVQLRPYQQTAITELRQAYASGFNAPLFVLPTGGGKTFTFAYIAANAAAKGNSVCILVHRKRLLKQASASLDAMGIEHGIIAPTFPSTKHLIQVASIQTLTGRIRKSPDAYRFDFLIPDEAHHATSPTWKALFDSLPNARILGVTATPQRTDGRGLNEVFDHMVVGPSMRDLIDMGNLVEPIVYAPPTQLDMSGVRTIGGDYDQGETAKRVDKPVITGSAIEHYRKLCDGQRAVVFCVTVEHAKHVAADFRAAGYAAKSIDGTLDDDECNQAIQDLTDGRLQVLTSCDMVSEGFDLPSIACAILLRPTKSIIRFLQEVGRALRPAAGKQHAIILDHVNNVKHFGMPDDDRDWSLSGKPKKSRATQDADKPPPVSQCEGCYAVFKPAPCCPNCGREVTIKGRKLKEIEGELEQVNAAVLAEARRKKQLQIEIAQATSLNTLMQIGLREGYQSGWAYKRWHARRRRVA
jgi:DNA repair protein RadD